MGHLRSHGLNVLLVEYRGYGRSTGTPELGHVLDDVESLPAHVKRLGFELDKVFVYGRSLGSTFAVHYAYTTGVCAGMIIDSGMASPYQFLEKRLPLTLEVLLERKNILAEEVESVKELHESGALQTLFLARLNTAVKLQSFQAPLLVLHTRDDVVLPLEANGEAIFKAVTRPKGQKTLVVFEGGGHNLILGFNQADYFREVATFLKKCGVKPAVQARASCCSIS